MLNVHSERKEAFHKLIAFAVPEIYKKSLTGINFFIEGYYLAEKEINCLLDGIFSHVFQLKLCERRYFLGKTHNWVVRCQNTNGFCRLIAPSWKYRMTNIFFENTFFGGPIRISATSILQPVPIDLVDIKPLSIPGFEPTSSWS